MNSDMFLKFRYAALSMFFFLSQEILQTFSIIFRMNTELTQFLRTKNSSPASPKSKNSALANTYIVVRLYANKNTELDGLLAKLIIGKVLITSFVDNIYFKAFIGKSMFEVSKCEYTYLS